MGARGLILIVLVGVAVGLPVWLLARGSPSPPAQDSIATAALVTLLAERLGTAPAETLTEDWLSPVLAQADTLRWAAVLGPDGQGYEFRRRLAVPTAVLHGQIDRTATVPTRRALRLDGMASQRFELCTWPQPAGTVLALVVDHGQAAGASRASGSDPRRLLQAVAAGIGVLGLVLAFAWLRWAIERPLQVLSRQAGGLTADLRALGASTPEELTGVVQTVSQLQREVRQFRREADELRETVDGQVAARTRAAQRAQQKAERDAGTDVLTGVESRAAFEREVPPLFEQARIADRRLALILIDVDHFKQHNDALGHVAGDRLLTFLGNLIRATLHTVPCRTFRYGGDEFVALLPDTAAPVAADLARRLAALFAQHVRALRGPQPAAALSLGVAERQQDKAAEWSDLLKLADVAMYFAKKHGTAVATASEVRAAQVQRT
ncbi:MAG: GGDEF domain-containing protein [Phycisphaerales bacterium]|nr:GGDEF domain-containing protein [Phycisphaerales bacterium]